MDDKITSNISMTNKDFQSIYPELLDLVKKLTNKWDPSLSNESDPGVLLLKLNALIADKNNYNIDKNVLECFPASVTQEGNARRLYDSLGYKMHWYRSAKTSVGFQLKDASAITTGFVTIPQFTALTDSTTSIVYTTLDKVNLYTTAKELANNHYVDVIEGKVVDLTVNGNSAITLNNLDADLRLYFNEENVAENGIFIRKSGDNIWTSWTKVDNILSHPLGQTVYEFGVLPNSNTCYIQFPEDIASILDSSNTFEVKYTLSNGTSGNIKANTLSSFVDNIEYTDTDNNTTVMNDSIRFIQSVGTIDGSNPETVDEAYRNYKRTIGTFNTLITRKDYENYLYNAELDGNYLVSNCVVADRTNDLNYTTKCQTWSPNFNTEKTLITVKDGTPMLNAYNVVIYALNSGNGTYDSTFAPNTDGFVQTMLESLVSDIKAIEHDFLSPISLGQTADALYYLYKNIYALTGQIVTYNKVSKIEAAEIERNVIDALEQNYNARMVDFGSEPDYNSLIETIQNADSRIKTIALNIPKYQINHVSAKSQDTNDIVQGDVFIGTLSAAEKLNIVARMILAGHVQLFKFDDGISYEFGMQDINTYDTIENIKSISTNARIDLEEIEQPSDEYKYSYVVKPNEVIQLFRPNYITTKEYSTYVKLNYYTTTSYVKTQDTAINSKKTYYTKNGDNYVKADVEQFEDGVKYYEVATSKIPANKDYTIKNGELVKLKYTTSDNITKIENLVPGTVINSSVEITNSYSVSDVLTKYNVDGEEGLYKKILGSGETLAVKEPNITHLNKGTKVYFVLKSNKLELNEDDKLYKILAEDEYFIYTNNTTDELIILGSGTMLLLPSSKDGDSTLSIEIKDNLALDQIDAGDLAAINWYTLDAALDVVELEITTLGEGAKLYLTDNFEIDNKIKELYSGSNKPIYAKVVDNSEQVQILDTYPNVNVNTKSTTEEPNKPYMIRSQLNINCAANIGQKLEEGQSIIFTDELGNEVTIEGEGQYVAFNNAIIISGGTDISAEVLNEDGSSDYSLKPYSFNLIGDGKSIPVTISGVSTAQPYVRDNGVLVFRGTKDSNSISYRLPFTFSKIGDEETTYNKLKGWLVQVYVNRSTELTDDTKDLITFKTIKNGTEEELQPFNSTVEYYKSGSYILYYPNDATRTDLIIEFSKDATDADDVTIGAISKIDGFNTNEINVYQNSDNNYSEYDTFDVTEINNDSNEYKILEEMQRVISASNIPDAQFDYTYIVANSEKVLQPTASSSFWNKNHLCNMYTIPQIDMVKTKANIKVNTYSIDS